MAFCTIEEIREQNDNLQTAIDVPDTKIGTSLVHARRIVKTDVMSLLSPSEFDSIDDLIDSTSNTLKTLMIYKSTEFSLVSLYGPSRKVDEVSDIQYYQKAYKDLLNKIFSGDVIIDIPEELTTASVSPDYPKTTANNKKFYPRKGVPGFFPNGVATSYKDDRYK